MSEALHHDDEALAALAARLERLERLEEQLFFQEQTANALNGVVTGQQKQIDQLEARLAVMETKFRELWELLGDEGGEATVPPHYMQLS